MGRLESERQGNDAQGVGTMMNCSDCEYGQLPEHTRAAIKALVQTHTTGKK
jgi:hypothetical protein